MHGMGTVTMGTMGGIRISWMGKKRSAGWMGWVDGMGGMGGIPIGTMGKGGVGREGTGRPEMGEISSTPSEIQSSAPDEYILWKRNNLDVQLSIYRWPGYARRKMWLFSFKFDAMGNVN